MEHAVEKSQHGEVKTTGLSRGREPAMGQAALHPVLQLQQQVGNQAVLELLRAGVIRAKLSVSQPNDPEEQEADSVADRIMRSAAGAAVAAHCTCAAGGEMCEECQQQQAGTVARKATAAGISATPHKAIEQVLRSPGRPLDLATRAFFEPRFGRDFSNVLVHTGEEAHRAAAGIRAHAFTLGQEIYFASGQYSPESDAGRNLLAHELTHTIQQQPAESVLGAAAAHEKPIAQSSPGTLQRSVEPGEFEQPGDLSAGLGESVSAGMTTPVPAPETCLPPKGMLCLPATTPPGAVTNTLTFPQGSATLNSLQKAEIDSAAASWHAAGGSAMVRVDGYASAEGECLYNWDLSCRRVQAVVAELETPIDHSAGVPASSIDLFAHGETAEFGPALAPNRKVTISIPTAPPPPPPAPPAPTCVLPVLLGTGRTGCGSGTDFTHFDFPSLSLTSELKFVAWAAAHPGSRYTRGAITDPECEIEMDGVLVGLAGGAGHAAFARFAAGTGGTETHGPSSTLGALALASLSFLVTRLNVQKNVESQLATQAATGVLDPCALSVIPPATHFQYFDGLTLKAVIGGTHGEKLFATGFSGSIPLRSYKIDLRFIICDNFGVDEADLYAPGLFAFWVLQHERSATLYAPFINELDLPVTVSGTF